MINIILILHNDNSVKVLHGALKRITGVEAEIIIPNLKNDHALDMKMMALKKEVQNKNLAPNDISIVIVESNYGEPASVEIKSSFFKRLKEEYKNAFLIAHSGTEQSLARVLQEHPDMEVLTKGGDFEKTQSNIIHFLTCKGDGDHFKERILSVGMLKTKIAALAATFENRPKSFSLRS